LGMVMLGWLKVAEQTSQVSHDWLPTDTNIFEPLSTTDVG